MRTLSKVFYVLAFLLFGAMCAVVAYNYCDMTWGIKYAGYSASLDSIHDSNSFCYCHSNMYWNCPAFKRR